MFYVIYSIHERIEIASHKTRLFHHTTTNEYSTRDDDEIVAIPYSEAREVKTSAIEHYLIPEGCEKP